jgi:hypothetical protein
MGTTRSFFQSRIGSADIFVEMLSLNPESGLMASSGSKVQHKHFRTDLPFVYSHRAAASIKKKRVTKQYLSII